MAIQFGVAWIVPFTVSAVLLSVGLPGSVSASNIRVDKRVDNPLPTDVSQTVEFTVTVTNESEQAVQHILILDKLPPQLKLPDVMAPHASAGAYSHVDGEWLLDTIEPGGSETLTVPAIYSEDEQPTCVVNQAKYSGHDTNNGDNIASIALRAPGVIECVDLYVSGDAYGDEGDPCNAMGTIKYSARVGNSGVDDAHNVILRLSQGEGYQVPGIKFTSEGCSDLECRWDRVPAGGQTVYVAARSDEFENTKNREHIVQFSVTSNDEDFAPDNNSTSYTYGFGAFTGICFNEESKAGGSSAGGCFIATAAYGTDMDSRIDLLREFRDRWLLSNGTGQAFVDLYYRHSPPVADFIATSPILRATVRGLLVPLLLVIGFPAVSLISVALLMLVPIWWFRIRKRILAE